MEMNTQQTAFGSNVKTFFSLLKDELEAVLKDSFEHAEAKPAF